MLIVYFMNNPVYIEMVKWDLLFEDGKKIQWIWVFLKVQYITKIKRGVVNFCPPPHVPLKGSRGGTTSRLYLNQIADFVCHCNFSGFNRCLCMYEIKVIYEYMLCLLKFRPARFFKYPLETIYGTGQRVSKISHVT